MRANSLSAFKKKFGLSGAQVNRLSRIGLVEIQQNGYRGHVLQHHKLIVYDEVKLSKFLESEKQSYPLVEARIPADDPHASEKRAIIKTKIRWGDGLADYAELSELLFAGLSVDQLAYIRNHAKQFDLAKMVPSWLNTAQ